MAVIIRLLNGTRISDVSWKLCGVLFGTIALSVINLSEAKSCSGFSQGNWKFRTWGYFGSILPLIESSAGSVGTKGQFQFPQSR